MRVTKEQTELSKRELQKLAPECKVYLFGSRVDDNKRGGDIDILVLTDKLLAMEDKWQVKRAFCERFGEQKIDLINYTFSDEANFKKLILLDAVEI